jgi:hypothetical protein
MAELTVVKKRLSNVAKMAEHCSRMTDKIIK